MSGNHMRDFPGHPVGKTLPSNAGDGGSIPGQGTKIPHAMGQLSPRATATEWALQPVLRSKRSHHKEKPAHCK